MLGDDSYKLVSLTGQKTVSIYGSSSSSFYVGSNGYITFGQGDYDGGESFANHFNTKRISCLFNDFDPSASGAVTWQQLSNRVVVTWQGVPELGHSNSSTFQVEMYFDGRIQLAWLGVESRGRSGRIVAGPWPACKFSRDRFFAVSSMQGGASGYFRLCADR